MKRNILLYIASFLTLFLCSFKSQAVPPLKAEYLPQASQWSVHELPDEVFSMYLPGLDQEITEVDPSGDPVVDELKDYAAQFLGRRYVWGSTGPKTFDCSGFTSYVFRKIGVRLNRTSRSQYSQGTSVRRNELQPGDLMFFSSPRTRRGVVGHVAIVVDVKDDGSCTFIHASTTKGITYQKFPDGGYFSRAYIGARRVLS